MVIRVTLTLEPIKVYVQYLQCGWSSWLDGLAQSPSEAVPFNLREGQEYDTLWMGNLWHFGRMFV